MRIKKLPKFSSRLKELRVEKGVKQIEMAVLLACTENHYQQIEYGNINISVLTLEALADYFGVSADYLLGRSEHREPR